MDLLKKILISTILVTTSFQSAFADCKDPVTYLSEGSKAPCTGYLFTPEAELTARKAVIDTDYKNKIIEEQNSQLDILNKRVVIAQEKNDNLKHQLEDANSSSMNEKLIYFAAGIIVTTAIVYATQKASP